MLSNVLLSDRSSYRIQRTKIVAYDSLFNVCQSKTTFLIPTHFLVLYKTKQLYQTTYSFAYISPKGVSVNTNKSKKQITKCLSVATVNKPFKKLKLNWNKYFKVCYCNQTFNKMWNVLTVIIYRCDDGKSRNSAKLHRGCSLKRFPETWMFRLRRKHQSDLPQDQHACRERRQRLLWSFYSSKF